MADFDWNDLRFLLALQEHGSLTAAARSLKVKHSTVSRRIDALEVALDGKLFVRTPDGFRLSALGEQVLPEAQKIAQASLAIGRVSSGAGGLEGVVRIATSEGFTGFLVKALPELRRLHPRLVVEVLTGNESLDLSRRAADLAVRIAVTEDPELKVKRIGEIGWGLYAAEAYALEHPLQGNPPDFGGHEVVAYEANLARVPGAVWLAANAGGGRVVVRGNSILSALNAALAGMGLAALPCFLAAEEPTLRRMSPVTLGARPIWLVVHRDLAKVPRIRAVMDFVERLARTHADRLSGALDPSQPASALSRSRRSHPRVR